MQKYLNWLTTHLPAIVIIVVAVLNILIKDKSIQITDGWADALNAILGAVGVVAHINNHT